MRKLLNLFEKISKYLLAAVLIIVPLLPKFPLLRVPGTYVSVRFEDLLMLFLAVILALKIILDFKVIKKDKVLVSFAIFFAATFISLLSAAFITETVQLHLAFLHWARRIEYMIPFFVAYLLIPREKISESILFYFKILVIVVSIAFFYGLGQRYLHFPIIITQNEEYSKGIALRWTPGAHINSTFAGHYDLAAYLVLIMPILLGAVFYFKGKLIKLLLIAGSSMGLWLLINSVSRMAQASYLIAVTVALFLSGKFKGWILVVIISLTCMFMNSGLDARFTQMIKVLYQHIKTGQSLGYVPGFSVKADEVIIMPREVIMPSPTPKSNVINDVSIAIRLNVEWPRAIRAFVKNPLLGTGYSSISLATDNDYLRMLGETGIVGFSAFTLVIFSILQIFRKILPAKSLFSNFEKVFIYGVVGGLVGTFVSAFFIDLFEASKFAIIFWLIIGISVSLIKSKYYEQ